MIEEIREDIGVCFSTPWTRFWCPFDPQRSPLISIPQFSLIFSNFGHLLLFLALRNGFWAQGHAAYLESTLIWGRNGIPNAVCASQFLGQIWHHLSPLSPSYPQYYCWSIPMGCSDRGHWWGCQSMYFNPINFNLMSLWPQLIPLYIYLLFYSDFSSFYHIFCSFSFLTNHLWV